MSIGTIFNPIVEPVGQLSVSCCSSNDAAAVDVDGNIVASVVCRTVLKVFVLSDVRSSGSPTLTGHIGSFGLANVAVWMFHTFFKLRSPIWQGLPAALGMLQQKIQGST
jgi:hypothetical protein